SASSAAEIKAAEIEMNVLGRNVVFAARRNATGTGRVEAELVIHLALLRVRKDFVGFLNLLELFLRRFVAGIQVRVILAGELSVSLADFLERRLARNAEQLVIILFG